MDTTARRNLALVIITLVVAALTTLTAAVAGPTAPAHAESAGAVPPLTNVSSMLSAGVHHACVDLLGSVMCWGQGAKGALGRGNTNDIGDNETPQNLGTVQLPGGLRAVAVAVGNASTCALLESGRVTCWGAGASGQLGYGNTNDIGDNETPAANPVNGGLVELPGGQLATQITAGNAFMCALLQSGDVTCWGDGANGRLGYGNTNDIGDNETPTANPVNGGIVPMPGGRKVTQVSAGSASTCAVLDTAQVVCWGYGLDGRIGYGNTASIGDDETPAANPVSGGVVALPGGQGALAVSVGGASACAILADRRVTCWGAGAGGELGYGNTNNIGDNETPAANPVDGGYVQLPATAIDSIDVGNAHVCANTSKQQVICWGAGALGGLGYGNTNNIGDNETPAQNPVNQGIVPLTDDDAMAVAAGGYFTCSIQFFYVECWGGSPQGQLGYGNTNNIGDNETPLQLPNGAMKLPQSLYPGEGPIPITPARLLDTRAGYATVDGLAQGLGPFESAMESGLAIAGRGGLPKRTRSVVLNVSVTGSTAPGFLTLYPCGVSRPNTANLNWDAGQTVSNGVAVTLDPTGLVCIYTSAHTDVIVDAMAYVPIPSFFTPVIAKRLLDTRPGFLTIDNLFQGGGVLPAQQELQLDVGTRASVGGSDVVGVTLNIAVTAPQGPGFVVAYPCGQPRPNAANVNYTAGQTTSNSALVGLGTNGRVCLWSYAATHLVVDFTGRLYANAPLMVTTTPSRLLDTRPGYSTVDGAFQAGGVVPSGGEVQLTVTGRAGVPALATSVIVNIAAVDPRGAGFVTAYPCGQPRPNAASITYATGRTTPNMVTVKVGAGGKICLYSYAATDLVADLAGYTL